LHDHLAMSGNRTSFLSSPKLDPSIAVKLDILGSDRTVGYARRNGAPGVAV
jgi:hypothetical protein